MSFKCCLKHIGIILRPFLYLLYLCPRLRLGLYMSYLLCMSYLCDLFFFYIFIFIMIYRIMSWIQTHLFFSYVLEHVLLFLDDHVDEECEYFSISKSSAWGCCLAFAWFFVNFSLALLIKVLLIKKAWSLNKRLLTLQARTKYLRKTLVFMWNGALRKKFNFCFSTIFC